MHIRILLVLVALILCGHILAQDADFARDPAISPDGDEVCFVYDNDLWIVSFKGGVARRITNTTSSEWGPSWSPDGKWIAFNSNRDGQAYPYLISPDGGEAQVIIRESYAVADWYKDSKHLLVARSSFEWGSSLYKLSLDGSRPILISEFGDRFASLSPDNTKIVYQKYGDAYRESYRGSLNGELWMVDLASKRYTKLTNTEYTERYPRYSHSSNALYYCFSDGDRFQLTKVDNMNFTKPMKLSNLPFFSARDISIARANDRIVFEHFNEIYKYDPTKIFGSKIQKLEINIAEDNWRQTKERTSMINDASDYRVSDDELLVAFNFKYDSFLVPRKGGEAKQLTFDHSGYPELNFINNRKLLVNKLHQGREQLYTIDIGKEMSLTPFDWFGKDSLSVERIFKDDAGRWQILYRDYFRSGRVAIADHGFTNVRALNTPWVVVSNFAINKAGTHAIYSIIRDDNYMRELYLYDFAADTHSKLLVDDGWLSSIVWSQDERSILLTRNRDLYRLDLVPRDEYEFDVDNWKEIFEISKQTTSPAIEDTVSNKSSDMESDDEDYVIDIDLSKEEASAPKEESVPQFEIVWEGLDKRLKLVLSAPNCNLSVIKILSDSTFLYIEYPWAEDSPPLLKKANLYGKNIKEEFNFGKGSYNFQLVGNTIYYQQKGALKSYNTNNGQRKDIKLDADYSFDVKEVNKRVFEQAWGAFGSNFYDPDMHGKDWKGMYETYRPYVEKAKDIGEVKMIIDEMIGDVNASHTAFYPRQDTPSLSRPVAQLGLTLDYSQRMDKGIKINRVYPDTRLSSFHKLKPGDIITHIENTEITAKTPIDSLLIDKARKQVRLTVLSGDKTLEVVTTAISWRDAYQQWYEFDVSRSRALVDSLSQGKLGYIHIPAMGNEDYNQFVRDVFKDNHDKKALVIDVRGNSGGRIHDQLVTLLSKKTYAYSTSRRYSREKRPEPLRGIDKPTIVLVDERSFSDGEIFPIIYQELKLGKVVGIPSSGAVIGTWEYDLFDGSSMRMPGSGWYKLDGTNMEGTGAMPDIIVENSPNDQIEGRDQQLIRAVHELLKEID